MCGRYSLSSGEFSQIQLEFRVEVALALEPRYNIAPTWAPGHEPPIVLVDSSGQRQPHHFHYDHGLFAFAGIWDEWQSPEGDGVRSFAIVTVAANDIVTPIHDRMPLRVEPDAYAEWLDPSVPGARALGTVRQAAAREHVAGKAALSHYEADPAGNDVRREGPAVISPLRVKQLGLFG
jgi:putative SOS response-associated peptidase YedK